MHEPPVRGFMHNNLSESKKLAPYRSLPKHYNKPLNHPGTFQGASNFSGELVNQAIFTSKLSQNSWHFMNNHPVFLSGLCSAF